MNRRLRTSIRNWRRPRFKSEYQSLKDLSSEYISECGQNAKVLFVIAKGISLKG
jgi:hypothetical protein